ncbi:hypothetical protein [Vibrio vulnificus]|uniref:Phage-related membrane protein n=1 Tax=Vibrio vulnificus TaxID=672 RepID=A0AAN1UE35_VIBVL|nr:hypothetical protein [Vibrio vulnificus]AXX62081.1 putative phage-related membrane protein [Vibrio vulnificus]HAU8269167.1 hypothetical protein [Vibrio vulnificus]HDY7816874.1 hypothetical protein [Vibrio vulnificus]
MNKAELEQLFSSINYQWNEDNSGLTAHADFSSLPVRELINASINFGLINNRVYPTSGRPIAKDFFNLSGSDLQKTYKVTIEINNPNLKIFKNIEHLSTTCPTSSPQSFIVTDDESFVFVENGQLPESPPISLSNYFHLSDIWSVLKEHSDDSKTNTITFLYRRKLHLKNTYSKEILKRGFDGYALFTKLLKIPENDQELEHKIEKNHILQNTLLTFLESIEVDERFNYLLNNFDKFVLRLDESYQAYVVGFSFDKLREKHEEKYREFMVAINDSISSMVMKSLMIPSGAFLLATRTQSIGSKLDLGSASLQMISNLGITACAIFISIVFYLLLMSEAHSLSAIKFEYKSLMGRLKDKSSQAYDAIELHEKRLSKRIEFGELFIKRLHCINLMYACVALAWGLTKQFPPDVQWFL